MNDSQLVSACCHQCGHTPSAPCADLLECIDHGPVCPHWWQHGETSWLSFMAV
jgi:hypothetical protein